MRRAKTEDSRLPATKPTRPRPRRTNLPLCRVCWIRKKLPHAYKKKAPPFAASSAHAGSILVASSALRSVPSASPDLSGADNTEPCPSSYAEKRPAKREKKVNATSHMTTLCGPAQLTCRRMPRKSPFPYDSRPEKFARWPDDLALSNQSWAASNVVGRSRHSSSNSNAHSDVRQRIHVIRHTLHAETDEHEPLLAVLAATSLTRAQNFAPSKTQPLSHSSEAVKRN